MAADAQAALVVWRALLVVWTGRLRDARARLRSSRGPLTSAAMVILGLGGALGGGALVGEWCLGLVLLAESAGLVWFGMFRDDGRALPRRGERTLGDVLEGARRS